MASWIVQLDYIWWYPIPEGDGSGTLVNWKVRTTSDSYSCDDIMIALNWVKSPDSYPVSCNFTNLTYSWVVLFMDPNNQKLVPSLEVYKPETWMDPQNMLFIYSIETGFFVVLIGVVMLYRQFAKISSYFFN